MKTFPTPYNPHNIPIAPGYRCLGRDEAHKNGDECWCPPTLSYPGTWCSVHPEALRLYDTRRRAICDDDLHAPPPEEWVREGWEVCLPSKVPSAVRANEEEQYWLHGRWCDRDPYASSSGPHAFIYYRRPIKAAAPAGRTIVVYVGESKPLSRAVQEIAFEAGWRWGDEGRRWGNSCPNEAPTIMGSHCPYLCLSPNKYLSSEHRSIADINLDARTDMGRLIDLLATPAKPSTPRGPIINGHEGAYVRCTSTIRFGCAAIYTGLLRKAKQLMDIDTTPHDETNRTVASITLSSGVTLTKDHVAAILKYVDEVNGTS